MPNFAFEQVVPATLISAFATWFGTFGLQWLRQSGERSEKQSEIGAKVAEHRDQLTFDLLEAAQNNMKGLGVALREATEEVKALQPLRAKMVLFQESLDHCEALVTLAIELSEVQGSAQQQAIIKRARAFLNRMKRLQAADGVYRNEAQIAAIEREARESLDTFDKEPPA